MLRYQRHFGLLLAIAVTACTLLACRPDQPSTTAPDEVPTPQPARGGTVVIGVAREVLAWNPYLSDHDFANDLLALLYPDLAIEQPDYRQHPPTFKPNLAESWQWSDDHLVLTMTLRQGATWSDGVAVTAEDVVFSWRTQLSPEVAWTSSYIKDFITSVTAIDSKTVRFVFNRRYPYQLMDVNDGLILPAHAWSTIPYDQWRQTDWQEHALSAGPFRLVSHEPHQETVLERNSTYWDPQRPLLDRVVFRIVPSQSSLLTQLRTGALDLVQSLQPREAEQIRTTDGVELRVGHDRRYTYLGWNNRHPVLQDRRVRRALTLGIDRQAIIDAVLGGRGMLSVGPVLTSMWAFNTSLQPLPYDPAAARSLLAEAGWTDSDGDGVCDRDGKPLSIELLVNTEAQIRQDIGVLVREQLARVGVEVRTRTLEWGALLSLLDSGEFEAYVGRWVEPTQIDLQDLWHSTDPETPSSNFVAYANAEVDRLIEQASEATDFIEQKPLLDRIQEIITDEQPYTFLFESYRLTGMSSRLHGVELNDTSPFFNLVDWYVSGQRPD